MIFVAVAATHVAKARAGRPHPARLANASQFGAANVHFAIRLLTQSRVANVNQFGSPSIANVAATAVSAIVPSDIDTTFVDSDGSARSAMAGGAYVGALDPNTGEDRAFEIIESLGRVMWVVDRAALVFCIDQVEDLRSLGDPEERFEKAIRDLIQITNRVPTAIAIVSSLEDFYRSVRERLPRSFIDRVEKAGPVQLSEARSAEEARAIIEKRLAQATDADETLQLDAVTAMFGPEFFAELRGLSPRRLLEAVQQRLTGGEGASESGTSQRPPAATTPAVMTRADGVALSPAEQEAASAIKDRWERFNLDFTADVPIDEVELISILTSALRLAQEESGGALRIGVTPGDWGDEAPGADVSVQHATGAVYDNRLFVCNRGSHGGALKRQIDKTLDQFAVPDRNLAGDQRL